MVPREGASDKGNEKIMNSWCEVLNVDEFNLADVVGQPDANYYSMLFAAVLHAGRGLTLEEAAARLESVTRPESTSASKAEGFANERALRFTRLCLLFQTQQNTQ